MKNYCFTLTAFLLLSACSIKNARSTVGQKTQLQNEVKHSFDEFARAAKTLDHERYFSFFDENNFSILNADGTTLSSFESFKDFYLPQLEHIEAYNYLKFDPVNINIIDAHNAILVNEFSAEVILKSGEKIVATGAGAQFWSKRTGEWKLVHVSDTAKK